MSKATPVIPGARKSADATKVTKPAVTDNRVHEINLGFTSTNPNHRVEFAMVDYRTLEIDTAIQRDQVPREINRIKGRFNPAALHVLTVSVREVKDPETSETVNRRFLVDGQQRQQVLIGVNWPLQVPAMIHYGLSLDEEAQLFLDLNDREGVGPWAKFKSRVVAGEARAVAIRDILEDLGIPYGNPGQFMAIGTADRIFSRNAKGPATLRAALSILQEVYDSYDGRVLAGLALVYDEHGQYLDLEILRAKLKEYAPTLQDLIRGAKTVEGLYGGKSELTFGEAIVNFYNRKMRRDSKHSKALPSLYLGKRRRPTGGDLDELAARRVDAREASQHDEEDDLDNEFVD